VKSKAGQSLRRKTKGPNSDEDMVASCRCICIMQAAFLMRKITKRLLFETRYLDSLSKKTPKLINGNDNLIILQQDF
jgi:hypothetical protein